MAKAFLVAESETLDPAALATYVDLVRKALVAAGGKPIVISSIGGRIIPLVGEPLTNLFVSERESVAKTEAWLTSPELRALEPQRAKAYRVIRQFIVETAGDWPWRSLATAGGRPTRGRPTTSPDRYVDPLFSAHEPARTSSAYVTFEPGARSAWHTHSCDLDTARREAGGPERQGRRLDGEGG
jgi:uncharacterized protein (DUF1330 family)